MSSLQVAVSNRQILKIALPISLALLVPNLNFIINNVFLGHLSEEALAVASITGVYYLIFSSVGYGLNNGLQALIARRAGENRPEAIGKIFHQGVLVAMAIALVGIVSTFTIAPAILRAVVRHPETAERAITFLQIRIWGLPFLYIYQMRNALLVGTNNSRLLVAGTLIEAVSNVLFDYALIFGHFGLPALGFNGAAFASIIAEFLGMFAIFVVIRIKGLDRQFSLFTKTQWDPENIRSILSLSGPLVFQHAISIIAWFFFYILIERNSGQTGLAVSNTMRNIFGFFGVFVWAFAATANAMVSNIIGQGRHDLVLTCIKKIQWISLGLALGVFVFLNVFPALYLSIYGLQGTFVEAGVPVIRVVSAALVLMSVATIWLNSVTGTGNSRITFLIELGAIVFYCLYVFLILERWHLSIVYAWLSEFLYWTVLFTGSYFYIKKGRWREKKI
ncbi:MATE family efflux transporter [Flaviaesturariibacter aridisoli]|uniref:Multidrug-efflux transporter n=1 Tax=Flaviaesturariibacter aridisoli TaxID=2545761 RepID=A0A4R4DX59_9BACT|nr:MATE family efflux transporter [Flaviaesturariibacter aridisoli]TCZ69331.1 MATE family efflux transporter [Flaviaesturariibacter aridisoli]